MVAMRRLWNGILDFTPCVWFAIGVLAVSFLVVVALVAMQCQHVTDSGQCREEATRDIRVVTSRKGWRIFLCDAHADRGIQIIREALDKMAIEQVEQKST